MTDQLCACAAAAQRRRRGIAGVEGRQFGERQECESSREDEGMRLAEADIVQHRLGDGGNGRCRDVHRWQGAPVGVAMQGGQFGLPILG